ncbi:hypothetical protein MTR_1g025180 [Medicago truncatula]|uniref:Uncharacterized protein n=2 Tax=Medicago truncatula TaxID=3880 RepID=G7I770_MEDTR|nr:hypothetical protein MTR_1g025180 [Medicago truncatula]
MDKTQNMKRGVKKQRHTNKLLFGAFQFSKKPKKQEKVRSLSAVTEMSCHVSEKQQEHPKRFKLHNNFLNGCYGASVPRKLRSAMKKRGRESILHDKEKVNHKIDGIESLEKDNVKKSKKHEIGQNWSQRGVFGSITKDEEEVAETLYALAAMFPRSGSNDIIKELDGEPFMENSSVLQDMKEKVNASLEASVIIQGESFCCESCLLGESSKITNETINGQELFERAKLLVGSHSTAPSTDLQTMPETVKHECRKKVALDDSELCLAMGLNMTGKSRILQCERKPDVELDAARNFDSKQKQQSMKEQVKNEGLALWPGLFSVSYDVSPKRSRKRCATHVYISQTIRSLESPKQRVIKESNLHGCHETRASERSKYGVLSEVQNLNRMINGVVTCDTARNPYESKNGILLQQCHYGEISQAASTYGVYGPQKQSFNLLSLSTGSYGLKVDDNNYNKVRSRLEPLSNMHVPYFQSLAQQQRVMPIPTYQSRYASTVYLNHMTVGGPQLQLQQPHYYGSQLYGTQYSSTVSNKQEQQKNLGMQQAAQGRSSVNWNIMRTQNPNWQSGRNYYSAMGPCAPQVIFPHTPTSQEIFGSKITSMVGQQQQLISPIHDKWARSSSQFYL